MVTANKLELLQIADAVAREKLIDRELVIEAMEDSMGKAARQKYGAEYDIRSSIDRKTGENSMWRVMTVVEDDLVENHFTEIGVSEAKIKDSELEVGSEIKDPLPPMDFGRIAAQTAKQVIVQQIRDAERARQYEEFKDRIGEIINGVVKRTEYGH
jgi:N utilization substance protein A